MLGLWALFPAIFPHKVLRVLSVVGSLVLFSFFTRSLDDRGSWVSMEPTPIDWEFKVLG